ncbi:MAG: hypothetical protein HY894_09785 [Deltaproteobacteria bacterium]|nr:hypothetical protein [Deltaproteobacteria bacterium]
MIHPAKGLSLGASYYNGKYTLSAAPNATGERDRLGYEFAWPLAPISIKAEYIRGRDAKTGKNGWYLQTGWFILPGQLQAVLKYGVFDPDRDKRNDETAICTIGANAYFNQWAFLQVNYEKKDEAGAKVKNDALTGQLTLQFQGGCDEDGDNQCDCKGHNRIFSACHPSFRDSPRRGL